MFKKNIHIILIFTLLIIPVSIFANERYVLICDYRLLELSETIAIKQIGVIEKTGKNDGIEVERYLKSVGLTKGYPYCMAGQYYCYSEAVKKLAKNQIIVNNPIPRSALANKVFDVAKSKKNKVKYKAKRHDFIVWRTPKKSTGHVERIIKIDRGGWVETVAFNTTSPVLLNDNNHRDGGGVYLRKRNILQPLGQMQIRGLVGFKSENK